MPKRQQLGLRGAETATFKKVPKWGVTTKSCITQHFVDKFCLENECCVILTDICCDLTDMTFLGALVEIYLKETRN